MVTIRLTRRGARNSPFYQVGIFNPVARKQDKKIELDVARIDHWVGTGAQMSDRVRALVTAYRKQAANA
jgi:small subunit ribosomal protein S16